MRTFIVGSLVAVLCASAGCDSTDAAPNPSRAASAGAGSATAAPAAKGPAKAGTTSGSAAGSAASPAPNADATPPARPKDAAPEKTEDHDAKSAKPDGAKKSGEGSWMCTGSASVRVCGFAGACNYQMVFGNGFGKDRFLASQQAKTSCEASGRAKGAIATCIVQCSVR